MTVRGEELVYSEALFPKDPLEFVIAIECTRMPEDISYYSSTTGSRKHPDRSLFERNPQRTHGILGTASGNMEHHSQKQEAIKAIRIFCPHFVHVADFEFVTGMQPLSERYLFLCGVD